jgi:hypothetical protein
VDANATYDILFKSSHFQDVTLWQGMCDGTFRPAAFDVYERFVVG